MRVTRREKQNFATDRIAKPTLGPAVATQQSPPLAALVNEASGQIHPLLADIITIGRDRACVVCIREDPAVSRRHAQILRRGVNFIIEDLGSANGVILNGRRITGAQELSVGVRIEIGSQKFQFKRRA